MGNTYLIRGINLSHPRYLTRSVVGASSGFHLTRAMMYTTKAAFSIMPGTNPPMRSRGIEIPDKLPRSTARAETGISISRAPTAMIGPVAMMGLYPRAIINGTIRLPSIAVTAIVEPDTAEKIVPATTATTASCPGTFVIRRSTASITFTARPVWNRTSPISTNIGMGVSEKLATEFDAIARELNQARFTAQKYDGANKVYRQKAESDG